MMGSGGWAPVGCRGGALGDPGAKPSPRWLGRRFGGCAASGGAGDRVPPDGCRIPQKLQIWHGVDPSPNDFGDTKK